MKPINLIPAERRRLRALRKRLAAWSGGLLLWCGLVAAAGAIILASADSRARDDAERRRTAAADALKLTESELATLRAAIDRAERAAEASDLVEDHPDWSTLLALINQRRGGEIALESLEVQRLVARPGTQPVIKADRPATRAKGEDPPPGEVYAIHLTGLALTVGEAQRFVVRLEESGVFDTVALHDTAPRALTGAEVTSFRVECRIADRARPAATPAKESRK
ncbi:MAG: hypothetical protein ACT4PL_11895 [Phycisphaerales bacterium]